MNEQLKALIEDYKQTNWKQLLREDLGEYNLKELKPYLDFAKNFIDPLVEEPHKLSANQQNNFLIQLISQFINWREQIKTHADTSQNQTIVSNIVGFKDWILDSFPSLSWALEAQKKYSPDKVPDKPETEIRKYISARKEIERELREIQKMRSQLKEQNVRDEASRYGDFFKKEAERNKKLSRIFGVTGLISSLVAGWFAYCFLRFDKNTTANGFIELLIKGDVINKVFIFSVIFLILLVFRREYLALRHQFTLNTHRHNALNSHKEVLSSIQKTATVSDKEIANAILLELTKSMFSSQDTGFVKNQSGDSSGSRIVEISKSLFSNSKE